MSQPFFSWHSGRNALVVVNDDGKSMTGYPVDALRAMVDDKGKPLWKIDVDGMRASLPRFEEPRVIASASAADINQAAASAMQRRGADKQLRGG